MTKFLRNRWLHRAIFAVVLVALGVGIYQVQEPEPTCVIDAGFVEPRCFIDCGRLVTLPIPQEQAVGAPNLGGFVEGVNFTPLPLKVWDTHSGAEIATFLDDKRKLGSVAFSKDGRRFAAQVVAFAPGQKITTALVLVDLDAGKTTETPLYEATTFSQLIFSEEGDHVLWQSRRIDQVQPAIASVYEFATGKLVIERDTEFVAHFADDLLVNVAPAKMPRETNIEIWNLRTGKPIPAPDHVGPAVYFCSANGRFVVEHVTEAGESTHKFAVWNLQSRRVLAEFQAETDPTDGIWIAISGDGRWLARNAGNRRSPYMELRELTTGRQVATYPVKNLRGMRFSPDGRFLSLRSDASPAWAMLETPNLQTLWQHEEVSNHGEICFSRDSATAFLPALERPEVWAIDCATGKPHTRFPLLVSNSRVTPELRPTPDRRFLLVHQASGLPVHESWFDRIPWLNRWLQHNHDTLIVLETDACQERFRLHGWGLEGALLSDDGRTLVTWHDEPGQPENRRLVCCWDLDAGKPLRWAVGVPAGLGTLGVLLVWWRGRKRGGTP